MKTYVPVHFVYVPGDVLVEFVRVLLAVTVTVTLCDIVIDDIVIVLCGN